ncbi:566_t:CDS:2 [Rhizophagus irregularis]|nr:566_t:CDS:2 [Rhizophagus irregularis]
MSILNVHYDIKTDTLRVDNSFEIIKKINHSSLKLKEEFFIHDIEITDTIKTEVPTTEVPTTEVPTTEVPTTEVPKTEVPTTQVPKTENPTHMIEVSATKIDPSIITKLKCKLCESEYEDNKSFNKHAKTHGYRVLCRFCSQVFFEKSTLDFHIMIKHDKTIFCRECGKKFWLQKSLEEHYTSVHQRK